jgi:hypothetical protein
VNIQFMEALIKAFPGRKAEKERGMSERMKDKG